MHGYVWIFLIALNSLGATLMAFELVNGGNIVHFILGFLNCFAVILCAKRLIED